MIGIPLGLLAANGVEWYVHKHLLHGRGQDKRSVWAFHWHEHHRNSRRSGHVDSDYKVPIWKAHTQLKEAGALAAAAIAVAPLAPVAPFFVGAMWYGAANYYRKHKKAHLDPAWARDHLPWHYDHHMGPDQNANWCVTRPWFDEIMGTRKPYLGTARAARDLPRHRAQAAPFLDRAPVASPDTAGAHRA